jgi:hypothetical protein
MEVVNDGLMIFVSQVKNGLPVLCEKYMWADEYMISIDTEIIPAGTHIAAEFQQLLKEPTTTVTDTTVRPRYLQSDLFGIESEIC